jgi:hypothetical protein
MINKRLARLESIHGISKSKGTSEHVAEFIVDVFENPTNYQMEGISRQWFDYCDIDTKVKVVSNLLIESGHEVSKHKVSKGISIYNNYEE